ncbi:MULTISPECIES: beta-xylosidase [unclassified Caballeronia]|uniref:beta-xylosidase n=1 Tax=unclassified Caballeronia TaxID=2646786 RepID=UPI002866E858|nr:MULTISPECIES: beta-xylosidase [unclassified Caballeronia]MDR5739639.1 beta-xylosidase [Caballeronia sp. LZ016]MDR5808106.1 beta-xylosidase [Caballeronia sp. LZ019]
MSVTSHRIAATLFACAAAAFGTASHAQITQPAGSDQQESRTSDSTGRANPSGTVVHESQRPQSKDAAGKARGATVGKEHKTDGAGGFNNGLYGTGAGNNK